LAAVLAADLMAHLGLVLVVLELLEVVLVVVDGFYLFTLPQMQLQVMATFLRFFKG